MADEEQIEEIVGDFMLKTCRVRPQIGVSVLSAFLPKNVSLSPPNKPDFCSTTLTGSAAEFYIEPMLPLCGDIDLMTNESVELAIPWGHALTAELPSDVGWSNKVTVFQIVDSEFPGYVYLLASHVLSLDDDTGAYTAAEVEEYYFRHSSYDPSRSVTRQRVNSSPSHFTQGMTTAGRPTASKLFSDYLYDETLRPPASGATGARLIEVSFDSSRGVAAEIKETLHYQQRTHGPATESSQLWSTHFHFPPMTRNIPSYQAAIELCTHCNIVYQHADFVPAVRCLGWPVQAADWPRRQRHDWPDPDTVRRAVKDGFDVVCTPHRLRREDTWEWSHQFRLSFSRAEVVLLNSWSPVQQLLYHMLRVFLKEEGFTESSDSSPEEHHLSNYHAKTLILWACELKAQGWWSLETNSLFKLFRKLLRTLSGWISDKCCQHFFISNCNLFSHFSSLRNSSQADVFSLKFRSLVRDTKLGSWFVKIYIRKYLKQCPESISRLFVQGQSNSDLKFAVNAIASWRSRLLTYMVQLDFAYAGNHVGFAAHFSGASAIRWRAYCTKKLRQSCPHFIPYFSAIINSWIAYQISTELSDDLLDSLWIMVVTHMNKVELRKRGSLASVGKALSLLNAPSDRNATAQQIRVEISKAYLYRALKCQDADSRSIYCLAHTLLAVLYRITGQYNTALSHCILANAARSGSRHKTPIAGRHLLNVSYNIDNVLGLMLLYQYLRASATNRSKNFMVHSRNVLAITPQLLASAMYTEMVSCEIPECHVPKDNKGTIARRRDSSRTLCDYRLSLTVEHRPYITDVLLFKAITKNSRGDCLNSGHSFCGDQTWSTSAADYSNAPQNVNPARLAQLLTQSAFEQLIEFRHLEKREVGDELLMTTGDYEAMYAYHRGLYRQCQQLCWKDLYKPLLIFYIPAALPEFVHLLDDKIVSLIGLMQIMLTESTKYGEIGLSTLVCQTSLLLHLLTECQLKLGCSPESLIDVLHWIFIRHRNAASWLLPLDKSLLTLTYRKTRSHLSDMLTVH